MSRFNRAPLVQMLAGLGLSETAPPAQSLAERWGPWLAWTDAIALSGVLGSAAGVPAGSAAAAPHGAAARSSLAAAARPLIDECQRLHDDLAQAIRGDPLLDTPAAGEVDSGAAPDADDLAALRRQHRQHQRRLDERIGPLRARLRAGMARLSAPLARLAALDAVLDPSLSARQRQLLAAVPAWLERGAVQRAAASANANDSTFAAASAPAPAPAAQQVRAALLAELDLRWQPIAGLLGALHEATAGGRP